MLNVTKENMTEMEMPEAWNKGIVHESFLGNGIYPPRCSGNCVIVGDICVSHAVGASNPDVKCLGCGGNYGIVYSCHDSKGVNNEGFLILDTPNVVKHIEREENNDMLVESDKPYSAKVISGIGLGNSDVKLPIGWYLSHKPEVGSGTLNDDEFHEYGACLGGKCSWSKFDNGRLSADLSAYNSKLGLCSESLSTSKLVIEGELSNCLTKNLQETLSFDRVSDSLQNTHHSYIIWEKISRHNNIKDVNLRESNFSGKTNSFSGQSLLASPVYSSSDHHRAKSMAQAGPETHARFNNIEFAHSGSLVPQLKFNGNCSQWSSQSIQVDALKAKTYETARVTFRDHTVCQKSHRGPGGFNPHQVSHWVPCQPHHYGNSHAAERTANNCLSINSSSAVSAHEQPNLMKFRAAGQDGLQPSDGKKVFRRNHRMDRGFKPSCTPTNRRQNSGIESNNGYKVGHGAAGRKAIWVPIGTKNSGLLDVAHSPGISDSPDAVQVSCNDATISDPNGNDVPLCETNVQNNSESSKVISSQRLSSVQFQDSKPGIAEGLKAEIACGKHKGTSQFTGLQGGVALNSDQRLQIASQIIQLMSGHPLAGIERFLHSAAIIVTPSILFDNHLSNGSLSKHKIPKIPLSAVWDWYEKPGNCGLEVKAENYQRDKESEIKTTPFHAYFLPHLSAIQLFSFPSPYDSFGEDQENINARIKDQIEGPKYSSAQTLALGDDAVAAGHSWSEDTEFALNFDPTDEAVILHKTQLNGGDGSNFVSPSACCSEAELIFEFFESEQPHKRKPLHLKIMELINAGTSNPHICGDPSKLESGNLHDIHPSSWFSVAWYPIYRIPEGKFRASFLTYHSVGQFAGKCIPDDSHNKFQLVFPVIGLKSYNTKGECWFNLEEPINPSSKASSTNSKILGERLRTLEETALLLSRGFVNKNKVNVANQHPDYEFFVSRNH